MFRILIFRKLRLESEPFPHPDGLQRDTVQNERQCPPADFIVAGMGIEYRKFETPSFKTFVEQQEAVPIPLEYLHALPRLAEENECITGYGGKPLHFGADKPIQAIDAETHPCIALIKIILVAVVQRVHASPSFLS